jgi:hypothetical protein
LHALGLSEDAGVEPRGCQVIRVEVTQAERQVVVKHGNLESDERDQLASRGVLWVYLPEALALARNLARAANGVDSDPFVPCDSDRTRDQQLHLSKQRLHALSLARLPVPAHHVRLPGRSGTVLQEG